MPTFEYHEGPEILNQQRDEEPPHQQQMYVLLELLLQHKKALLWGLAIMAMLVGKFLFFMFIVWAEHFFVWWKVFSGRMFE